MSWSESVYLDCVSPDGRSGFIARLARHTDEGRSWLWTHVFTDDASFSYNRIDLPCGPAATEAGEDQAVYALEGDPAAWFSREGSAAAPSAATVDVTCSAHRGLTAPETEGEVTVHLAASFTPDGTSGSNLAGRTESLGAVKGEVEAGGRVFHFEGRGHFHEQHQDSPRFAVPFTYGTLRGEEGGMVFVIGPRASGGFLRAGGETVLIADVSVTPVGPERDLRFRLPGREERALRLTRTHHYLLPVVGHPRESSVVTANGPDLPALSGCVNDWSPPASIERRPTQ